MATERHARTRRSNFYAVWPLISFAHLLVQCSILHLTLNRPQRHTRTDTEIGTKSCFICLAGSCVNDNGGRY
ncbi:hypothetical protein GALMADRAFT_227136 [Galerina marginata CBS 339.88]|uniref:Uncharacterized protein n=1 Tax=Galerina marginata (strain CBS 339.88) TaxID=685588 RepID=A0A067SXB3_GALM3|nr:hypothetical protein GALMADRAFT_227136 [Galerina marginata CBS 339.88]